MPEEPNALRGEDENNPASPRAPHKRYTLRPTVTPIAATADSERSEGALPPADPFLRAAHEDDDGYDPYSDRREEPPLFEREPWD
ncbi:hypothetical protein [Gordonibacter sp.]|uniref:hypothetical protein n=1 Tax=Gordonibacter sp. TaxID=1968902 RepID=UPI002FC801EF